MKNNSQVVHTDEWPCSVKDSGVISCVGGELIEVVRAIKDAGKFAGCVICKGNAGYEVRYVTLSKTTDEKTVDRQEMLL